MAWRTPLRLAGVLPVLICVVILLAVIARAGQGDGEVDLRDEHEERTARHAPVGRRHR